MKELLASGLIVPSKSSFASAVVEARVPERAPRFCIDYRVLNKITVVDKYPLPSVEDVLRNLAGFNYYFSFDLKSEYWQIRIKEEAAPTRFLLQTWNVSAVRVEKCTCVLPQDY